MTERQEGLRPRGGRHPRQVRQHSQFDPWTRGTGSEGCRYCFSCCRALARCLMYAKRPRTERWTLDMLGCLARAVADSRHAFLWIVCPPDGSQHCSLPPLPRAGVWACAQTRKAERHYPVNLRSLSASLSCQKREVPRTQHSRKPPLRISSCGASKLAPRLCATPASHHHQQ